VNIYGVVTILSIRKISCYLIIAVFVFVFGMAMLIYKDTMLLKVAIYPVDTSAETYYFTLNQKGELNAYFGHRYLTNNKLDHIFFMEKVENYGKKQLAVGELSTIFDMIQDLERTDYSGNSYLYPVGEFYYYIISYCGNTYYLLKNIDKCDEIELIVEFIIEISPIEVVI